MSRSDATNKRVLERERVCSKQRRASTRLGSISCRLGPTVALGKKKYVEKDHHENAAERALRAKKRRQRAIERTELEAAEKKKRVHESGVLIAKIDFSDPISSASEVEQHSEGLETASVALELDDFDELDENTTEENPLLPDSNTDSVEARRHSASKVCKEATTSDSSYQTDEFEYMFFRKGYQAPTRDFLDSDSKVLFYRAGMLAGSTPMTGIFCEYLPCSRLSRLLAYSESTGIPLDESPVLLSFFFFLDIPVFAK